MENNYVAARINHAIKTELSGLSAEARTKTVRLLIKLLDEESDSFSLDNFIKLSRLEKNLGEDRFFLSGCKKAASFFFQLSKEEKGNLRTELSLMLKKKETLESFMCKALGSERSGVLDSIENASEDFEIYLPNRRQEDILQVSEIIKIARKYYENLGYTEVAAECCNLCVEKDRIRLNIILSTWFYYDSRGWTAFVTVLAIPKL